MNTRVVQKAVITNPHGQVLLIRRSKTDVRRPLDWDLPGGLREEGEELIPSVVREITEETGLEVEAVEPVYAKTEVRSWRPRNKEEVTENVVFIFYCAKAKSQVITLSYEHDEYVWLSLKEAIEQMQYYLQKELLEYIQEHKLL